MYLLPIHTYVCVHRSFSSEYLKAFQQTNKNSQVWTKQESIGTSLRSVPEPGSATAAQGGVQRETHVLVKL